eukprot:356052-Chlamydomonas_euryale.AAC.3
MAPARHPAAAVRRRCWRLFQGAAPGGHVRAHVHARLPLRCSRRRAWLHLGAGVFACMAAPALQSACVPGCILAACVRCQPETPRVLTWPAPDVCRGCAQYTNVADGGAEYQCCPHSATALIPRGCDAIV